MKILLVVVELLMIMAKGNNLLCVLLPALWPGHQGAQNPVDRMDTLSKHCNAAM